MLCRLSASVFHPLRLPALRAFWQALHMQACLRVSKMFQQQWQVKADSCGRRYAQENVSNLVIQDVAQINSKLGSLGIGR